MIAGWMRWMRPSTSSARRSSASQSWTTIFPRKLRARSGRRSCSSSRRPARRPSPPATRTVTPLARDAVPLELVEHRGQRIAPRVVLGRGQRQRRRLDDDRRPAPAGRKCLERLAGERVAERLGDRRSHVRERVERRWRGEQERVVGEGHERDARAGVQGDARHAGHLRPRLRGRAGAVRRSRETGGRTSAGTRAAAGPDDMRCSSAKRTMVVRPVIEEQGDARSSPLSGGRGRLRSTPCRRR